MSQGPAHADGYTVVARRYRPQRFDDVVGQDHVVQALRNAIKLNRLAQAYLFCGTRGVGKTSMARIFAKCLNCAKGLTDEPCQVCDVCQAISVGQDVDVIEIDGASNNGVEQVRELRQNVSLRPSRSRFKIYYIDEVHMLSTGAFNALLKTLEEPPPHVKFFFATTEANKIPITVLSRCQRFDFAGITPEAIVETLKEICDREGLEADADALQIVARRAGGSMRDAQSLLERMLSSGGAKLTADVVHGLLGTASDERLLEMIEALAAGDSAAALTLLDRAATEGVQPTELLSGTIDFLRDAMVLTIGAEALTLTVAPRQKDRLKTAAGRWSADAILAALQILAEARGRMRGVAHGRLLAELALVRVARLEDLDELAEVVQRLKALEAGAPAASRASASGTRKRLSQADSARAMDAGAARPARIATPVEPPPRARPAVVDDRAAAAPASALTLEAVRKAWPELLEKVGAGLSWRLRQARPTAVEAPDVVVIAFQPGMRDAADHCGTDDARRHVADRLARLLHRRVTVRYDSTAPDDGPASQAPAGRRPDQYADDPLVQKVVELFEARLTHVDAESRDEP